MNTHDDALCTAFAGTRCIATGSLGEVAAATKQLLDSGEPATLHVFHNGTSEPLDLDLRGSLQDVVERYPSIGPQEASPPPAPGAPKLRRGPGRPRLGVVSKEVTLMPRHWAWLGTQPGGASATLRRLVHLARVEGAQDDRARQSQDAAYRFMYAMVGNQPGFEEATRALFAGDAESFKTESEAWPPDLRDFSRRLATDALLGIETP
jgi:hypothetical protein